MTPARQRPRRSPLAAALVAAGAMLGHGLAVAGVPSPAAPSAAALVDAGADARTADGLRELLRESARRATAELGRSNGYQYHEEARIGLPKGANGVVSMLRAYGYGRLADPLVVDINRGAEIAASRATPAIEALINDIRFDDVDAVVHGGPQAATRFLCSDVPVVDGEEAPRATFAREYQAVVNGGLVSAGYYRSLQILLDQYNAIPVLSDVPGLSLEGEIRDRALEGLCWRIGVEEAHLRDDPDARPPGVISTLLVAGSLAAEPSATTSVPAMAPRPVTRAERQAAAALREVLVLAADRTGAQLSRPGGYLKNPATRIALPDALQPAARALRDAGLGNYVDELEIDMNVSAEIAAASAPLLLRPMADALAVPDALIVLHGDDGAATRLLRATAEARLQASYRPAIQEALRKTGLVDSERAFLAQYAALPGAERLNVDLAQHVLDRAIDGLFTTLAAQEAAIRHDPAQRPTRRLRKAFGPQ